MDKMNKYTLVWGAVLVLILGLLTTYGFFYKNKTKVYKDLEEKLAEAEKIYVDENFLYPSENQTLMTLSSELIEENYLDELKVNNDVCTGYVVVSHESNVFDYKAYVKCKDYTTQGYDIES